MKKATKSLRVHVNPLHRCAIILITLRKRVRIMGPREIARRTSTSPSTAQRLLDGQTDMSLRNAVLFADALGMTITIQPKETTDAK